MKAVVRIRLKPGVLDPQGKATRNALGALGFSGVGEVRQGKLIEFDLDQTDAAAAREYVDRMARELLANTVIETYEIEIDGQ
ncbi:Phosphoribosylformylglycinamidine synthase, PurS subunit [hydrothermal vent metagenome]|uniref:Phosphoribosylformylglycinamidine synthase, PurS subunit n=1 Tax=hydrothermal vent metagenome TaxID=652676 RepID=A0A3B0T0V7_9ZZZZ